MLCSTKWLLSRGWKHASGLESRFSGRVFVCFITPRIAYEAVSFSRHRIEEKFVLTA